MQKLELDKRNAESKLHTLEIETDVYRNSLNQNGQVQDADTPRGEAVYSGTNSSSTPPSLRDLPTKGRPHFYLLFLKVHDIKNVVETACMVLKVEGLMADLSV